MRILLLGASGQLGFELKRTLNLLGDLITPTRSQLNLADEQSIVNFLANQRLDLIVNAAAYTAVDKAESEHELAFKVNAELPRLLADYCRDADIPLIHYSTDYVYDGEHPGVVTESHSCNPLSVYGASKLKGDLYVQEAGCKHLIFRTSWVYGRIGHNFMNTMIKLAYRQQPLSIVSDQLGAPTSTRLISQVTLLAIQKRLADTDSGVYHLTAANSGSWFDFALLIFQFMHQQGLLETPVQAQSILTKDYPTPAKRPMNSCLDLGKIQQKLNIHIPSWRELAQLTLEEVFTDRIANGL